MANRDKRMTNEKPTKAGYYWLFNGQSWKVVEIVFYSTVKAKFPGVAGWVNVKYLPDHYLWSSEPIERDEL